MSLAFHTQAKDNINKIYAATQGWHTNPADIRLPDSINTKRPKLSNRQIASRYLKSVDGNPNIDINKKSQIRARDNINSPSDTEENKVYQHIMKRSDACEIAKSGLQMTIRERSQCEKSWYFSEYKASYESGTNLVYQLIGSSQPECLCIKNLPEFIVCSDENLTDSTLANSARYPKQIISYREPLSFSPAFPACHPVAPSDCLKPASTPNEINQQIDAALHDIPATRIYLSQAQLDGYIAWRKANGTHEEFIYIRVIDKPKEMAAPLSSSVGGIVGGIAGFLAMAGCVIGYAVRQRNLQDATNVTTATEMLSRTVTTQSLNLRDRKAFFSSTDNKNSAIENDTSVIVTMSSEDTAESFSSSVEHVSSPTVNNTQNVLVV